MTRDQLFKYLYEKYENNVFTWNDIILLDKATGRLLRNLSSLIKGGKIKQESTSKTTTYRINHA